MWPYRVLQKSVQRDPDRDIKRRQIEMLRTFRKKENEIKLGLVLEKDLWIYKLQLAWCF